jgi:hypothetical protein
LYCNAKKTIELQAVSMAIVESKKLTLKAHGKWNIGRGKKCQVRFSLQISKVEATKLPTKTRRALFCISKASHCKSVKLKLQNFPQKQEEPCSALAQLHTANQ